jgi:uncharacterized repeat protein (TIGR03803 family)
MQPPKFSAAFHSFLALIFFAICCAASALAAGPHEALVYTFPGAPNGYSPTSALISDVAGNLYGTTYTGGNGLCIFSGGAQPGCGTVFELSPTSTGYSESVIYSFEGGTDGMLPYAGLVMDAAGNLYGATEIGGNNTYEENGEIFELSPPRGSGGSWTFSTLSYFASPSTQGAVPVGPLIFDRLGNLYGTTEIGGASNDGTVFELSPPAIAGGAWTETVLHSFSGTDGILPGAGLSIDAGGNLYGTTYWGGNMADCNGSGCGVVFKLLPGTGGVWSELVLHRFTETDGAYPLGALTFKNGNYYGTTSTGIHYAGYVFQLSPGHGGPWIFNNIYGFGVGDDGGAPYSGVIADRVGNLYGTTYGGGTYFYGTAYKLTPPTGSGLWTETILVNFNYPTSFAPIGGLLLKGNRLFGTTTDCTGTFFAGCGGYGNVFAISNF